MVRNDSCRGFTLIEALIGVTLTMVAVAALGGMLVQSAKINSSQQMKARVLSDARTCVSMIVQRLRSAGWDPQNAGIPTVVLDPADNDANHADGVDNLLIFADLNGDGETDGTATDDDDDEQILIRHAGGLVEWQPEPGAGYVTLVANISNDADGDGTAEPMFVPDSATSPTQIVVRVTAESPDPDPVSGQPLRYTVTSQVVMRKSL
jgi:type II secretory pathway pseudopilin PulG